MSSLRQAKNYSEQKTETKKNKNRLDIIRLVVGVFCPLQMLDAGKSTETI